MNEKLLEEIAWHLIAAYDLGQAPGPKTFSAYWFRERAKGIISRIGEAYAKGELELPGEVGRFKMQHPMNELQDGDLQREDTEL